MRVEVRGLRKSYPTPSDPLVVLDGLDLTLEKGDAIAVTGPSGCGKSTLLHILGTLDTPDEGSVRLGDVEPFGLSATALSEFRNRDIGFVFQDHYLLPQCTVLENVLLPTLPDTRTDAAGEEQARGLLERVGLAERVGHRPSELSGGERQRAAIARALVQLPGLLLCDEPTGNLDEATASRISELFLELCSDMETTVVVVTHSSDLAARIGRRLTLREHRLQDSPS